MIKIIAQNVIANVIQLTSLICLWQRTEVEEIQKLLSEICLHAYQ